MTPTATASPSTDNNETRNESVVRSPEEKAAIKLQDDEPVTEAEVESATDYFLSDEEEQPTALRFQVNMAAAGQPARWVWWTVRSIGRSEIKELRKEAQDPNTGLTDEMDLNVRLVVRASMEPDFSSKEIRKGHADPADALLRRTAHKPGIIEAIARKCNDMSGYGSQDNVIRLVDAAGN